MCHIFNTVFIYFLTRRISVHNVTYFVKNMLQFLGHRLFYTCAALEFRLCTVTEVNAGKKMIWNALPLNMHNNKGVLISP